MPSPKKISVADILNDDIPDSPILIKEVPNSQKKTKWTEMARQSQNGSQLPIS